ncbi:hypothetical protein AC481_04865 [miscellaneous Crenarchaeota group archaeon SMTZ-80]|nr:MAG: hypothetical protein AC481_04865 [miscellaneous Crenarchaeota group archaeon SMTZ-80]
MEENKMKKKKVSQKLIVLSVIIIFIGVSIVPSISAISRGSRFPEERYKENVIPIPKPWINPTCERNPIDWTNIEVVSTESTDWAAFPSVAVDINGTVHVVWMDETNYGGSDSIVDIVYKFKPNGGDWSTTEVVSTESNQLSYFPSLAVEIDGTVHIVWAENSSYGDSGDDYDIFYKMKTIDGYWTTTELVSVESINDSLYPSVAVDNEGTIHVVWDEFDYEGNTDDTEIYYKMKPSGGNWKDYPTEVVSSESTNLTAVPVIDVDDSGAVHVAWMDLSNYRDSVEDWDIFYKMKSGDGIWTTTEVVSSESYNESSWPSLAVEPDGTVHIAWDEFTESWDSFVVYKQKSNEGEWTTTELVSTESSDWAFEPSIAVNEGSIHVAWIDYSEYGGAGWDSDIFYKMKPISEDWTITEVISTGSVLESRGPNLAVDNNGMAHVVWEEEINFPDIDIYYRRQNLPPETPDIPSGPSSGEVGVPYNFTTSSNDPNGDMIKYGWDWNGDFIVDDWTNFIDSGEIVETSHSWETGGDFEIRVKAKDKYDAESDWSEPLIVDIVGAELEIGIISGDIGAISTKIRNIGEIDATDIDWSITIEGGILGLIDILTEGTVESLVVGEETSIKTDKMIFGLGKVQITVEASGEGIQTASKTADGFVFLVFITIR